MIYARRCTRPRREVEWYGATHGLLDFVRDYVMMLRWVVLYGSDIVRCGI